MNEDFSPPENPCQLFSDWFALAVAGEPSDPNAMTVATVGPDGMPAARLLLMKDYDEKGFVFYTNRESRKGGHLALNAKAALNFFWKSLQRQVRVEGTITLVSEAESDAYFASRPRGSQIGAWASQQSRTLENRAFLEKRIVELTRQYEGKPVPRPPYWGGYRLEPILFEFWQAREYRLHDRFEYKRERAMDPWGVRRLFP